MLQIFFQSTKIKFNS